MFGLSAGRGHCVVFLGKTLYSHSASLHPEVNGYRRIRFEQSFVIISAHSQQLDMESFLYNADMDGSSLLHMAVDSGALKVSCMDMIMP